MIPRDSSKKHARTPGYRTRRYLISLASAAERAESFRLGLVSASSTRSDLKPTRLGAGITGFGFTVYTEYYRACAASVRIQTPNAISPKCDKPASLQAHIMPMQFQDGSILVAFRLGEAAGVACRVQGPEARNDSPSRGGLLGGGAAGGKGHRGRAKHSSLV